MSPPVLTHMTTGPQWRAALADGVLRPDSLETQGFVHLSAPEQVHRPANALYAGRTDLVLLCLDPARLTAPVRWEPGTPRDPAWMRFPHLYGPVPVAAAVAVLSYRPGEDGTFAAPGDLPGPRDVAARARAWYRHFPVRRAGRVVPVAGGLAVLDDRHPVSHEHNRVLLEGDGDGSRDTVTIIREADRVLAGLSHRSAVVRDRAPAAALAERGWRVEPLVLMALSDVGDVSDRADRASRAARRVDPSVVHPFWRAGWRAEGLDEASVSALVARETTNDEVVLVADFAVLDDAGTPLSSAQLRVDGATAALEAVRTEPEHRGRGHGGAVVAAALAAAAESGVDLVVLEAAVDDWPRHWYARTGFREVDRVWECTRP